MRSFAAAAVLSLVLGAAPVLAQAPQPAAPAAASAQAPRPFPEGAKFAYVNIQRVAAESAEGKASTGRVQALNQQKVAQLNDLNKKLQDNQQKLQTQGSVLSDDARAALQRDIEKQQKDIQRFTQDAQEEVQNLQGDLQNSFQQKLLPIIQKVVAERGIQILFSQNDAGLVWADPGLDITADVIKRFDAATAPSSTTAPAATTPAAPAPAPAAPAKPQSR